jgi:hypothetical protein
LLWLLTPDAFYPAGWLVPLAALIPLVTGFYYMFGTGVELGESTRSIPLVGAVGFGLVVCLVTLLIPVLGAPGAFLGNTLGIAVQTALICWVAQRRLTIPYDWLTIVSLLAFSLAAVAGGYFVLGLSAWPRVALTTLISLLFPVVVLLVLFRSSSERHRMQILRKKLAWRT